LVDAIYVPVRNGIDYGVDVLQAVLAPIPLANIAGDQVSILWNSLVQPVSNSVVFDLIDPVLNQPLNINSYINGAYDVGATTVNSLINTGINEINYFAGFPLIPTAAAEVRELDRTSEVNSVPSIVKTPIESNVETPGPLSAVAKTVRNVRNDFRAGLTERRTDDANKIGEAAEETGNDVVRAPGEIRGAVTKAVSDVTNALRPGKPSKSPDSATTAPTNVVKSIGDTARNVVKQVREAAKDTRDAVKNRPASDADE
jgi:gas vesicle protein